MLLITILLCDNSVCFSHSSIRKVFNAANQVKQNISQILQCFKAFLVTECVLFFRVFRILPQLQLLDGIPKLDSDSEDTVVNAKTCIVS